MNSGHDHEEQQDTRSVTDPVCGTRVADESVGAGGDQVVSEVRLWPARAMSERSLRSRAARIRCDKARSLMTESAGIRQTPAPLPADRGN